MATISPSLWYVLAISYTRGEDRKIDDLLCQAMDGPEASKDLMPRCLSVDRVVVKIERGDTFRTYKEGWPTEGPELQVITPDKGEKFVKTVGTGTSDDDLESLPVYQVRPAPVMVSRLMVVGKKPPR